MQLLPGKTLLPLCLTALMVPACAQQVTVKDQATGTTGGSNDQNPYQQYPPNNQGGTHYPSGAAQDGTGQVAGRSPTAGTGTGTGTTGSGGNGNTGKAVPGGGATTLCSALLSYKVHDSVKSHIPGVCNGNNLAPSVEKALANPADGSQKIADIPVYVIRETKTNPAESTFVSSAIVANVPPEGFRDYALKVLATPITYNDNGMMEVTLTYEDTVNGGSFVTSNPDFVASDSMVSRQDIKVTLFGITVNEASTLERNSWQPVIDGTPHVIVVDHMTLPSEKALAYVAIIMAKPHGNGGMHYFQYVYTKMGTAGLPVSMVLDGVQTSGKYLTNRIVTGQ